MSSEGNILNRLHSRHRSVDSTRISPKAETVAITLPSKHSSIGEIDFDRVSKSNPPSTSKLDPETSIQDVIFPMPTMNRKESGGSIRIPRLNPSVVGTISRKRSQDMDPEVASSTSSSGLLERRGSSLVHKAEISRTKSIDVKIEEEENAVDVNEVRQKLAAMHKLDSRNRLLSIQDLSYCQSIERWSVFSPSKVAINILDPKGSIKKKITYLEFWTQSGIIARHLLNEGVTPQSRVMVIFPMDSVLEYLITFLGCLRIGAIVVSVYPPNPKNLDEDLKKLANFVDNAQASIALTTLEYSRFVALSSLTKTWPKQIKKWLATESLLKKPIKSSKVFTELQTSYYPLPDDIAFIQYTSGSTGNPKGVPIHYASFMNTLIYGHVEYKRQDSKADARIFVWVPIYHDYGLITSLGTVYRGAGLFNIDPVSFVQNPLIWPELMEKFEITFTVGPNFSYALVGRKIREAGGKKYDLRKLIMINIAAEPIMPETIKGLIEDWGIPKEKIVHSYGMAEACLWVSSTESYFDPDTKIAASGDLKVSKEFGMQFLIANKETLTKLPDGVTGEIFLNGVGIVKKYWNNPEASKAFENKIKGKSGRWYHTGDLGYVKNGKLFVSGRSKDVIIVNGKNIYATDIERIAEEKYSNVLRPGCSAAFQTGEDTAAIVCEYKPGKVGTLKQNDLKKLKAALEQEFGLQITDIIVCLKGSVPKTTSGKIRRSEAKKMFLAKKFVTASNLQEKKKFATFEALLRQFDVKDMNSTLLENGLDSLKLTNFLEEAQSQFGLLINFDMAQQIPCGQLESTAINDTKVKYQPKPPLPEMKYTGTRINNLALMQIFGILGLVLVFCICSFPSAYLYQYFTSDTFFMNNPNVVDPLIVLYHKSPGLIFIIIPFLWMIVFTVAIICLKWIIIGRYKPTATAIWSAAFFRWWFIDRLLDIWETFIGGYLVDTPYLNLVYYLLGADIPIFKCRFKVFVREFDLLKIGNDTSISGVFSPRCLDLHAIYMDKITVFDEVKLEGWAVVFPGESVTADSIENDKAPRAVTNNPIPLYEQIQRVLFPLIIFCAYSGCGAFIAWIIKDWALQNNVVFKAIVLIITFYGSNILLMVLSSALLAIFGSRLSFTADRLAECSYDMMHLFIGYTLLLPIIHHLLYGTDVDFNVQMNKLTSISASEGKFVSIRSGTSIGTCSVSASREYPVKIGSNATIGMFCHVNPGCEVGSNSDVSALSVLSENRKVPNNTSFFSPKFSLKRKDVDTPTFKWSDYLYSLFFTLIAKAIFLWAVIYIIFAAAISSGWIISQVTTGASLAAQVLVTEIVVLLVAAFTLVLFDIITASLFTPMVARNETMAIDQTSFLHSVYLASENTVHFLYPFLSGTFFLPLILRLKGAKVGNVMNTFMMGNYFDAKLLSIGMGSGDATTGWDFVSDVDSVIDGHKLEHGKLIFQETSVSKGVCLSRKAIVLAGQHLGEGVSLLPRSRVSFAENVKKTKSGMFYGLPAKECL